VSDDLLAGHAAVGQKDAIRGHIPILPVEDDDAFVHPGSGSLEFTQSLRANPVDVRQREKCRGRGREKNEAAHIGRESDRSRMDWTGRQGAGRRHREDKREYARPNAHDPPDQQDCRIEQEEGSVQSEKLAEEITKSSCCSHCRQCETVPPKLVAE
jgi:hypothetical protein